MSEKQTYDWGMSNEARALLDEFWRRDDWSLDGLALWLKESLDVVDIDCFRDALLRHGLMEDLCGRC